MANKKGNPGNKGGGRKSAYQERADAETLFKAFFQPSEALVVQKRVESGTFSIWDRVILTALEGDTKILALLTGKVFPDKQLTEHSGGLTVKWEG